MIIYGNNSFKPRKKPKAKPKGVIARKLNVSTIARLSTNKLPTYSRVPRVGAEQANLIASLVSNASSTEKRESIKYTGTKIIGVAVLHKSCLQPISSQKEAEEVARMRR
jgi:hypothetical protein